MIANPPFVRELRLPHPAERGGVAGQGASGAVLARPPLPDVAPASIIAARNLPGSAAAPKVVVAPRPSKTVAAAGWSKAQGAVFLSTALHLGLVAGWAVLAAPARPLSVPDLDHAKVELVSEAQFAALSAPQPAPDMTPPPALLPPSPVLASAPPAPEVAMPELAATPLPESPPPVVMPTAAPPAPAMAEPAPPLPEAAPQPEPAPVAAAKPVVEPPAPKPAEKPAQKPAKPAEKAPAVTAAAPAPATKSNGAKASQPGVSGAEAKALTADWGSKVRSRINRKVVQPKDGNGGTVKVRITLAPNGSLLGAAVAQSSGQAALDAAALKAVKAAAPFPKAPKGLTDASYSFSLPITFK